MMVPRSIAGNPFGSSPPKHYDEKDVLRHGPKQKRSSSRTLSPSRSPPLKPRSVPPSQSDPVAVPKKTNRAHLQPSQLPTPSPSRSPLSVLQPPPAAPRRKESVQELLAATSIPIRRRPKQRSAQRIPSCDYVTDFSKLMMDDVTAPSTSVSSSISQYDGLFGNIDELVEGDMFVGSEGINDSVLSSRSMSTESMPSLASPEDYSSAPTSSVTPSFPRSTSDRRLRQIAASKECASEHPLSPESEDDGSTTPEMSMSPPQRQQRRPEQPRKPSSFKSSLTASLKAIKSAAQSVSNYTTSQSIQPEDFLSHSVFDIQPSLTDDRRPPLSNKPPSPALRRYLNPSHSSAEDSPAQLHFWLDSRSSTSPSSERNSSRNNDITKSSTRNRRKHLKATNSTETSKLPPIVPLATCIPPTVRTAHASSPPIWLAPDGTPSNKQTASQSLVDENGGLKQREPRENRDFLRVFVAEMQMRKTGKLDENAEGRAKMWLPPVEEGVRRGRELERGEVRWGVLSA